MASVGFRDLLMITRLGPAAVRLAAVVPGVLIALGAAASVSGAFAQEFCVSCQGPEASYRCLIGGEGTAAARSSRGQFLCITELAKTEGHTTCSVSRNQATPCPGETRTVLFSLADPDTLPLGQAQANEPGAAPVMGLTGSPSGAVGSTVPSATPGGAGARPPMKPVGTIDGEGQTPVAAEDGYPTPLPPEAGDDAHASAARPEKPGVIQDMANKTGKAFNDTGKAVGKAVKKSWDCVTSLFGNC